MQMCDLHFAVRTTIPNNVLQHHLVKKLANPYKNSSKLAASVNGHVFMLASSTGEFWNNFFPPNNPFTSKAFMQIFQVRGLKMKL